MFLRQSQSANQSGGRTFVGVVGLACTLLLLAAGAAQAAVPQTITIDGVNDFDPSNLLDADGGDTEETNFCADDPEVDTPMDIKDVYVTNDANNLYIGFVYDRECFSSPQVNLGIAFSYGVEGDGGTTDPFNRKIAWNSIVRKPDNVFYVVIDGFNYEALYGWNGASWDNISGTVNPGYGSGSNGLGMANDSGFEELALPLSVFGLTASDELHLEIWMTQDGTTKPPLDNMASDLVQTSTSGGTVFDTAGPPIEMTDFLAYTIQADTDTDPPLVTSASHSVDSQIDMSFNEPVDPVTAAIPGNYVLTGGTTAASVTAAVVDGGAPNIVHLTLSNDIIASADAYRVTVTGVDDGADNTIVNDGVGNVGCFGLKEIAFQGDFLSYLQTNSSPPDGFTVEGSKAPLSFAVCDGGDMTQIDAVNEIWEFKADFSFPVNCADDAGSLIVEWKFNHNCLTWESIGNRSVSLDILSPSTQTLTHFWDDLDPDAFTDKAIDVIFRADMNNVDPPVTGLNVVELAGSAAPLSFGAPFAPMLDDGLGQDAVAGDLIYTAVASFPPGTIKNVEYKFVLDTVFECLGIGNRGVFLNDELFDTIGGTNGPITMPVQFFDRCFQIGRDVEVVFSVDLSLSNYVLVKAGSTVQLTGSRLPLSFDIGTSPILLDNGVLPDVTAGDHIYTGAVVFPDATFIDLEYKYAVNGAFEGQGLGNRFVVLDDTFDAISNPQVLPTDDIHNTVATGIDDRPQLDAGARLLGARPNPFNPRTTIIFEVPTRGSVRLEVFDARGRHVTTLADREYAPGVHEVQWDGRSSAGQDVGSGVYYARLMADGGTDGHKLILLK